VRRANCSCASEEEVVRYYNEPSLPRIPSLFPLSLYGSTSSSEPLGEGPRSSRRESHHHAVDERKASRDVRIKITSSAKAPTEWTKTISIVLWSAKEPGIHEFIHKSAMMRLNYQPEAVARHGAGDATLAKCLPRTGSPDMRRDRGCRDKRGRGSTTNTFVRQERVFVFHLIRSALSSTK